MMGCLRDQPPEGRRVGMVPRRQCIEPGPHVKARHGGVLAAGPIRERETTHFMATTTFPTRDDFAELLNKSLGGENEAFEGKVVKGTVTAIENDLAVIDVGLKSEGRVALREFAAPGQKASSVARSWLASAMREATRSSRARTSARKARIESDCGDSGAQRWPSVRSRSARRRSIFS